MIVNEERYESHLQTENMEGDPDDDPDAKGLSWRERPPSPDISQVMVSCSIESTEYRMNRKPRGKCLIINQKDFEPHTRLQAREGTDRDAFSLYRCFRGLDFDVDLHHNLRVHQIESLPENISTDANYHSISDCFVCCILSHGDEGVIFGTDGKFSTDKVFEPFTEENCPSLAGKPKIFFIQACQGDRIDKGADIMIFLDKADCALMPKIQTQPDFLIMYSTVPGYLSWRNTLDGSWFIQALCDVLTKKARTEDLLSMTTPVNYIVAYEFECLIKKKRKEFKAKQVSCVTSTLIRKIRFFSD